MKHLSQKLRLAGAICLASTTLLTVGCGGNTSGNAGTTQTPTTQSNLDATTTTIKQGGTVRTTISSEIDNLDPHLSAAADTESMMRNVFEGLIGFTDTGAFIPQLASDYTVSEDGLTYIFKIREDVAFHNGKALTADDVVYSYGRLAGLNGEQPLSSDRKSVV